MVLASEWPRKRAEESLRIEYFLQDFSEPQMSEKVEENDPQMHIQSGMLVSPRVWC